MPTSHLPWIGAAYCGLTRLMPFFKRGRRKMFLCRANMIALRRRFHSVDRVCHSFYFRRPLRLSISDFRKLVFDLQIPTSKFRKLEFGISNSNLQLPGAGSWKLDV